LYEPELDDRETRFQGKVSGKVQVSPGRPPPTEIAVYFVNFHETGNCVGWPVVIGRKGDDIWQCSSFVLHYKKDSLGMWPKVLLMVALQQQ
jgi:hypothetical protein